MELGERYPLGARLDMHRIDKTGAVVKGGDDQAARTSAITLKLHTFEQKAVGDARCRKHNMVSTGQFVRFVDTIGFRDAHLSQASQIALSGQTLPTPWFEQQQGHRQAGPENAHQGNA